MTWFFLALATSICWGLGYVLVEKLLHGGVAPVFILFIIYVFGLPAYFAYSLYEGSFKQSLEVVLKNPDFMKYTLIFCTAFVLGNLLIFQSIQLKNATYAQSHRNHISAVHYPVHFSPVQNISSELGIRTRWNFYSGGCFPHRPEGRVVYVDRLTLSSQSSRYHRKR